LSRKESMVVTIVREDVQVNDEQRDCPTEGQKKHYGMINSRIMPRDFSIAKVEFQGDGVVDRTHQVIDLVVTGYRISWVIIVRKKVKFD